MARIAILDDLDAVAEMLAGPLMIAGHDVLTDATPLDFERIVRFSPQVVVIGMTRKPEAVDRPIGGPEDIVGYDALGQLEAYPAINVLPILLVGIGLREGDIPTTLNYDLFLSVPEDAPIYVQKIEELAVKVKTRRKLSGHVCPHCRSRMVYVRSPDNLFCPRCGSAVSIHDSSCHALGPDGHEIPCSLGLITPPPAVKPL